MSGGTERVSAERMSMEPAARLARCLTCETKVKIAARRSVAACPRCGLALVSVAGMDVLPPLVVPRWERDACWRALLRERGISRADSGTSRGAHLALVPFWREAGSARDGTPRAGVVLSGADLQSAGLPLLTTSQRRLRGADVEARSRSGDAMGRLEGDGSAMEAAVMDVTLRPGVKMSRRGTDDGTGWKLFYYPFWSFRYLAGGVQHFHMVDAVTGRPLGPARRSRHLMISVATGLSMLAIFLILRPSIGAFASVVAWAGSIAALRIATWADRRPG